MLDFTIKRKIFNLVYRTLVITPITCKKYDNSNPT